MNLEPLNLKARLDLQTRWEETQRRAVRGTTLNRSGRSAQAWCSTGPAASSALRFRVRSASDSSSPQLEITAFQTALALQQRPLSKLLRGHVVQALPRTAVCRPSCPWTRAATKRTGGEPLASHFRSLALDSLSTPSMTLPKTTCLPSSLGSAFWGPRLLLD